MPLNYKNVESITIYLKNDIPTYESMNRKFIYESTKINSVYIDELNVIVYFGDHSVDIFDRSNILFMEITKKDSQE